MTPSQCLTVSRTYDLELVRSIITHPSCFPSVSDDNCRAEEFRPSADPRIIYLLAMKASPLGIFMLVPESEVCLEIHTCLLPHAWGPTAREVARLAETWIWSNTTCKRLITKVPEFNQTALKYALQGGMLIYGFNPASFLHEGRLRAQFLLGKSNPVYT